MRDVRQPMWKLGVGGLGIALVFAAVALAAAPAGVRSIFLNGADISSARSQELRHVDVRIADNGDIFITAPHYQVAEEDSYVPLSQFIHTAGQPAHAQPQRLTTGPHGPPVNAEAGPTGWVAKTGEPLSPPAASQSLRRGEEPSDKGPDKPATDGVPAKAGDPPPSRPVAKGDGDDDAKPPLASDGKDAAASKH